MLLPRTAQPVKDLIWHFGGFSCSSNLLAHYSHSYRHRQKYFSIYSLVNIFDKNTKLMLLTINSFVTYRFIAVMSWYHSKMYPSMWNCEFRYHCKNIESHILTQKQEFLFITHCTKWKHFSCEEGYHFDSKFEDDFCCNESKSNITEYQVSHEIILGWWMRMSQKWLI